MFYIRLLSRWFIDLDEKAHLISVGYRNRLLLAECSFIAVIADMVVRETLFFIVCIQ